MAANHPTLLPTASPETKTLNPTSASISLNPTSAAISLQPTPSSLTLSPTPNALSLAPTPTVFDPSDVVSPTASPTLWGSDTTWSTTDTIITAVVVGVFAIGLGLFIWSYQAAVDAKAYKMVPGDEETAEASAGAETKLPPGDSKVPPPPKESK